MTAPRAPAATLAALGADLPPLIAQLCLNRGITTRDEAERFFSMPDGDGGDPFRLPDMAAAVGRIERAVRDGETIALYGDYDVDGVCSLVVVASFLEALGARVVPYVPSRQTDGYGLRAEPILQLREAGATLLLSVDCGISCADEVAYAAQLGMDVVVTDHHRVPPRPPRAVAVVDAARDDVGHPDDRCLAGVGVAYRLAQALATRFPGSERQLVELLPLVAVATVADVVPLTGQNRTLVQLGLRQLRRAPGPGLATLATAARISLAEVDAGMISFRLAPRLNAAGRMGSARVAYDLLRATSREAAQPLVEQVERFNVERQREQLRAHGEAAMQLDVTDGPPRFIVVDGVGWSLGTVGLVASKLADAHCRPSLVLVRDGDSYRGSARSIPGFDVTQALASCADLLTAYGGHAGAGGCTVPADQVAELRRRLVGYAGEHLTADGMIPTISLDARVRLTTLDDPTVQQYLARMGPFGAGNDEPRFMTEAITAEQPRRLTTHGDHLSFGARDGSALVRVIAFGMGEHLAEVTRAGRFDIAYTTQQRTYQGASEIELCLQDLHLP